MIRLTLFALSFSPAVLVGQPAIYFRGIVNGATFAPAGLPSGSIAQGSLFTIYGSGLGPSQGVQVSSFPLGTTFAGASIRLTQGDTQVDALPVYVSASQINAIMPSNTPLGTLSLRVTYNGQSIGPAPVKVVRSSFGFFTIAGTGSGPGIAQNFVSATLQPLNSTRAAAAPGQTITLYGTGLGPATGPDNIAPAAVSLAVQVEAWVGGQIAKVVYSGRSPCCSGLDQIVLQIPDNAPTGCWVPVRVRTAQAITSNTVTISIGPSGSTCSDPDNAQSTTFVAGGKIGILRLLRSSTLMDVSVRNPVEVSNDFFHFDFSQTSGGEWTFSPLFSVPPAGSCNEFLSAGDLLSKSPVPAAPSVVRRLAAGASFTLSGPRPTRTLAPGTDFNMVSLGSYAPLDTSTQSLLTLDPGNYTLAGTGGADVGAFSAGVTLPPKPVWVNRDTLGSVDRAKPLTISWTGVPASQQVAVWGASVDRPTNGSAMFYCLAPKNATSFTIPVEVLGALPATRPDGHQSKGAIYLFTAGPGPGSAFQATGLDAARITAGYLIGKTVVFQ